MNSKIINSCNDLESLFKEWTKAHKEEPDDILKLTMPRNNGKDPNSGIAAAKNRFCFDGYIGDNRRADIAFVLKESNASDKIDKGEPEEDRYFWFKKLYNERDKDKSKQDDNKYYRRLLMMSKKLGFCLGNCAYVNLQKRGGFGTVDNRALKKYTEHYSNYILRELEILEPGYIVCLGTFDTLVNLVFKDRKKDVCTTEVEVELNGDLKKIKFRSAEIELFKRNGKSRMVTCINMYHPAYRCNDDYYKDLFTVFYERLKKTKN